MNAEQRRLQESDEGLAHWKRWGPYLSERAWGTVREDYSADGDAWRYFPHRAGALPRLPLERGRTRRHLRPAPAHLLRPGALERTRSDPEGAALRSDRSARQSRRGRQGVLLLPRLDPDALVHEVPVQVSAGRIPVRAAGERERGARPRPAGVRAPRHRRIRRRPVLRRLRGVRQGLSRRHPRAHHRRESRTRSRASRRAADDLVPQSMVLVAREQPGLPFREAWRPPASSRSSSTTPCTAAVSSTAKARRPSCSPATRPTASGSSGHRIRAPFVKDGIDDFVVADRAGSINPDGDRHEVRGSLPTTVSPGGRTVLQLRLADAARPDPFDQSFADTMDERRREADAFYASVIPADLSDDAGRVMRQALAGLLWSKQFYHYDVRLWLEGDPGQPRPPAERKSGRNHDWPQLNNADVISMPDKWEYPWYAAWDLAFHTVALAIRRRRVREVAARPAAPRVVHAPQRTAARLRMELQRRQPAGPRVGGAARVPDRSSAQRPRRSPVPGAGLPQAAPELHVVGQPEGRRRQQHFRRRLSRPRQHRRLRSQPSARRPATTSSRPTARAGWRCSRSTCSPSRWSSPPRIRPTKTSRASSGSTSSTSPTR